MLVGYARVSSTGQNLDSQIEALKNIGCEKIFMEKKSGTSYENRIEFQNALDFVRENDTFVVTRLDRCSRSVPDLYKILEKLKNKKVSFKAINQNIDTSSSTGKLMLGMLSIIAEFENDLRRERQAEGIKRAKELGKYDKQKCLVDNQVLEIIELQKNSEFTNKQIAQQYNIARSTLLKYVAEYKMRFPSEEARENI
jgi:DNA invertase Pin-like site-specific DNA recombinase